MRSPTNSPHSEDTTLRPTVRHAAAATAAVVSIVASRPATAQAPAPGHGWELLAASGALIPTGAERASIKDAPLSTVQLSYVAHSRFAITTMVGWARSRDLATANTPKLDVFTYDLGVETRAPRRIASNRLSLTPFMGMGLGGRSYDYRKLDADATHNLAGYASAGGELGAGRVHLRLELRDYVSGSKPLGASAYSATRNDLVAMIGLRFTKGAK